MAATDDLCAALYPDTPLSSAMWLGGHDAQMLKDAVKKITHLTAELAKRDEEIGQLRELFECVCRDFWGNIEYPDHEDFEAHAERLGLLVTVPASEEIAAEFETKTMLTWAWADAARKAEKEGEE